MKIKTLPPLLLLCLALTANAQHDHELVSEEVVNTEATFIDGLREQTLGNYDKAIKFFEEVLQKEPRNAAAAYQLAKVYLSTNQTEKARSYAEKAVQWDDANPWYKILLADIYQKLNEDALAAQLYEKLARSSPNNEEYYLKWAYHLVRAGKPKDAIAVYDQLEKRIGINEETARNKHTLYIGLGDYKKAAAELQKLIDRFPNNTAYRHQLATFYEQINDKEAARAVYQQILQVDPDDARARIALAEEAKGNDDIRFLQSLKPVFENPTTPLDTKIKELIPYVQKLADEGDRELGANLLALATLLETIHPGSAKVYSLLGDVRYYSGDSEGALEAYRRCLELDDTVWQVWEQTLFLLAEKRAWNELLQRSEQALDIFPNQATAYYYHGMALTELGKPRDALSSFQQALIMASRNTPLRFNILVETGRAYCLSGQLQRAINAFEEAAEMSNRSPRVLAPWCHCLLHNDDIQAARLLAQELVEKAPNQFPAESAMAEVFYRSGDYEQARQWLEKALQHGGDNHPDVLERYGDVSYQLGHADQALDYWKRAKAAGSTSNALERKIQLGKLNE